MRVRLHLLTSLLLVASMPSWVAVPEAVGVVISDLPFLVDDSEVRGNATILEDEDVSTVASWHEGCEPCRP